MATKRIGITGASGFIARTLAGRLARQGHQLVGLDLDASAAELYRATGGRLVVGDITDPERAREFATGLDVVFHTAAAVRERGPWSLFERVNVRGTAVIADAADRAGVRELVHFSSVMVYGFDYPNGVTEAGQVDGAGNPYCETKIRSEQVVLAHHRPSAFDVYVIRPGDVYGPGSLPWTMRPVQQMLSRRFAYIDSRRAVMNHVYVDNLLDGVDLLWQRGASGAPYAITDDARTSARAFFSYYQRFCGVRWFPEVPGGVASAAARLASWVGLDLGFGPETVRYLRRRNTYSIEKIKALGYVPRVSLPEGMERCRRWLVEQGLIRA